MSAGLTITSQIHFSMRNRGRREMKPGPAPITETTPEGSVPRVSRLMALAIKMDGLIRSGAVPDQGDLAALGHVTRARVTQILNLTLLAPDIQEAILFLARVRRGREFLTGSRKRTGFVFFGCGCSPTGRPAVFVTAASNPVESH